MADVEIRLKVSGERNLSKVVNRAEKELKGLGDRAEASGKQAGGLANTLSNNLAAALTGTIAAYVSLQGAQKALDFAKLGTQIEQVRDQFTAYSGSARPI